MRILSWHLVRFLLWIIVPHQFRLHDRDLPMLPGLLGARLELLPDHHDLAAVIEFLHEVPGLESGHPRDVNIVNKQDLVTNF